MRHILTDSLPIGTSVRLRKDGSHHLTTSFAWITMDDICVYISGSSLPHGLRELDIPRGWNPRTGVGNQEPLSLKEANYVSTLHR